MGAAKPCLGYPSRTAAVIGLRAKGLTTAQIADAIGIEDNARQYADLLGMAACAAILQNGQIGLWPDGGPISTKTTLVRYPEAVFPAPDNRRVVRSQFQVSLVADWVLQEAGGPGAPLQNPYEPEPQLPSVQQVNVSIL